MARLGFLILGVMLTLTFLSSCGGSDDNVPRQKYDELQRKQEELQDQLKQLREQERAEILGKAQAYDAIIKFYSEATPVPMRSLSNLSVEEMGSRLQANAKLWNLIKATQDPVLISACQPQDAWNTIQCRTSYLKNYVANKYSELMAEYNSQ